MSKSKKPTHAIPDSPYGGHVEFDADELKAAFAVLRPIIEPKATRALYTSFHLRARAGKVTISATDGFVSLQVRVPTIHVEGEGVVMMDAGAAFAMLKEYPDPRIRVHLDAEKKGEVRLSYQSFTLRLPGYNPEKELTTEVPGALTRAGWTARGRDLAMCIGMTRHFSDDKATRFALGGILLDLPKGEEPATVVGTDGRQLALARFAVGRVGQPERMTRPGRKTDEPTDGLPVIPSKAVSVAERMARQAKDAVIAIAVIHGDHVNLEKTVHRPGRVQFVTRDEVLTCEALDGRFPRYTEVFPTSDPKCVVHLDRASRLGRIVRLVEAGTDTEGSSLELTLVNGSIMIEADCITKGRTTVFLNDLEMTGKDMLGVKAYPFRRTIDLMKDRSMTLRTHGPKEAFVFQSGPEFEAVMMPLEGYETRAEVVKEAVEAAEELPDHEGEDEPDGDDDGSIPVEDTLGTPPAPAPVMAEPSPNGPLPKPRKKRGK